MISKLSYLYLFFLVVIGSAQFPIEDEVTQYFQNYPYKIYSGNLVTNYFPTRKTIHYVFYQSQRDHQKDPVFLWLTGGPGCSSMATMMQQNGPLRIEPGSTGVTLNDNAWNKRANLLYFELPSGVGYSQQQSENTTLNDQIVSQQAMTALNIFYQRFPSLKKNELYIGGSGYAANFVTRLSINIIQQNQDEYKVYYDKILIKGVLYGNPCIYPDQCFASGSERQSLYHYQFLFKRGFYPKSAYYKYLSKCAIEIVPYDCYVERINMDKNFNATNTSAYNIYSKCYTSSQLESNNINTGCEDQKGVTQFFNSQQFKQNWNINKSITWTVCSADIWNQFVNGNGTYHLLPQLIKKNIRMWVYSGDMDSTVSIFGTEFWLKRFREEHQIPIKKNWREWWIPGKHKHEDQVGGYIWELEGMNFVTVKGAGFKASYDQPMAMSEVFNGFLTGQTLPYKADF